MDGRPCTQCFKERKIQQAFFKVFTSLLRNYRTYLKTMDDDKRRGIMESRDSQFSIEEKVAALDDFCQDEWFKKSEFLASMDKESKVTWILFLL